MRLCIQAYCTVVHLCVQLVSTPVQTPGHTLCRRTTCCPTACRWAHSYLYQPLPLYAVTVWSRHGIGPAVYAGGPWPPADGVARACSGGAHGAVVEAWSFRRDLGCPPRGHPPPRGDRRADAHRHGHRRRAPPYRIGKPP